MDNMNNMNNSISRESIDSLNDFIADYERKRDAHNARKRDAYERTMRKQTEFESSFTYNLAGVAKDLLELTGKCLAGLAKIALVAVVLFSPYILEAIIDKWL